jgi:carbon monoxide dehydrogenase subunit G
LKKEGKYMPSGIHQVDLELPIGVIWNFVKDLDNWAPLVPGYVNHEKINQRQSTWEFKGDIGILKKKVSLMIDIKEWTPPHKVCFDLKAEKYVGEGYFEAREINKNKTTLIGFLEVTAVGAMETMKNSLLKTAIPKSAEEMALAISSKLVEQHQ